MRLRLVVSVILAQFSLLTPHLAVAEALKPFDCACICLVFRGPEGLVSWQRLSEKLASIFCCRVSPSALIDFHP